MKSYLTRLAARFAKRSEARRTASPRRRSFAPSLDALEERTVMAGAIMNLRGVLWIVGTHQADVASVVAHEDQVIAKIATGSASTVQKSFTADQVKQIMFVGGNGDDAFANVTGIKCVAMGLGGSDLLIGGTDGDVLLGGASNDVIIGRDGNDVIEGNTGHDRIYAGDGNDRVYGGAGVDAIAGGAGSDGLYGNADRDLLFGDSGMDVLVGGAGDDVLDGGDALDFLVGQGGRDAFFDDLGGGIILDQTSVDSFAGSRLLPTTPGDPMMALLQVNLILSTTAPVAAPAGVDPLVAGWQQYQKKNPSAGNFFAATADTNISALQGTNSGSMSHWGPNDLGNAAGSAAFLGANATGTGYFQSLKAFGNSEFSQLALKTSGYSEEQLKALMVAMGLPTE